MSTTELTNPNGHPRDLVPLVVVLVLIALCLRVGILDNLQITVELNPVSWFCIGFIYCEK